MDAEEEEEEEDDVDEAGGVLLDLPLLSDDCISFLLTEELLLSPQALVLLAGDGSAPIWLHVCASSARGLRLASNVVGSGDK